MKETIEILQQKLEFADDEKKRLSEKIQKLSDKLRENNILV